MNRRFHKGSLFIPLLYIAIIVSLVFLQFSGNSIFTENLNHITLSGTLDLSEGVDNPPVASVIVEYRGLQLVFDENSPLLIEQNYNTDRQFFVNGYQRSGDRLTVSFEQGIELIFAYDSNQMTITNKIPRALDNPTGIGIPFIISTGSKYELSEDSSGLYIDNGKDRFILALPPQSYINFEERRINIPEGGLSGNIRYTRRAAGNETISALWSTDELEEITPDQYRAEIADFTDRAYLAWKSNRYNPLTGTWAMGGGEARFSEDTMVSLLSEAWLRNEYTRVFNEMRTASDLHPSELTYRSSVFLGNLRRVTSDLESEERQTNIQINNMINQNNAMVFLTENLFQYALTQENNNLLNNLLSFTTGLVPGTLTPLEALGLNMNYYVGDIPDNEIRQTLSRFTGLVNEKIIPSIGRVDEGFFFLSEPGIVDIYQSTIAGLVLIEAGMETQDNQLTALGHNIVLSVIRLSDQMGFLPAQIELTAGAISATQGNLLPEALYPLISDNPYYPRRIILSEYFDSGSWIYATINNFSISSSSGEFTLSFANVPNRTHYLFFRGIPNIDALNGMELFGIIWRNAPDFEIYSKGRYYNSDSQTLMIKFFDDDIPQDIKLFY